MALRWYFWFKAGVFTLLACNAAYYLFLGTLSQGLDTTAWLILLALFEVETGRGNGFRGKHTATAVRGIRLVAAAGIIAAAFGYVLAREWLDASNSALWIAVVVVLEFEVRYPRLVERHRAWFVGVATTLYVGLAALVPIWAWRGDWIDAYDALLWLVAFVTIEINVLQFPHAEFPGAGAAASKSS
jgi:hypothetical protein